MSWFLLVIAGLFEVGFAACLAMAKQAAGREALAWYGGFALCLAVSMALLVAASRTLPIGTAYAVWTGIGAVGTAAVGILFFHEPADLPRVFFLTTLIVSLIGLKLVSH